MNKLLVGMVALGMLIGYARADDTCKHPKELENLLTQYSKGDGILKKFTDDELISIRQDAVNCQVKALDKPKNALPFATVVEAVLLEQLEREEAKNEENSCTISRIKRRN
jgi:hypothetical protein